MKTIKFYTLGCKVNQYDTQVMREQFLARGFRELTNGAAAQVYLINTCTVTGRADSESLGFIRRAEKENPRARVIVTGCLAELDADKIKHVCPAAVIVKKGNWLKQGISGFSGHTRAFLKIQDGCDNFCAYCKVPLARGPCRSKPLQEIVSEAAGLARRGFKEIVLCGICLGAWGKDLRPAGELAEAISCLEKIPGLLRLRLSSIEAGDISAKLIAKFKNSKILCPHLHIPMQSGDDEILQLMLRQYRRADYLGLAAQIREDVPGIAITTDCLVGFPGEEERHFQNTISLLRKIIPLKTHVFPFSARPGTKAASLPGAVSPEEIKIRACRLRAVARECALKYQQGFLGKKVSVLVEQRAGDDPACQEGHSDNYIKVRMRAKRGLRNQLVQVKLKEVRGDYCLA
ncbi:MAG: hypothetical protein A3G38_00740 [Omnitrophica WOR_2 bacterium RIFCSPLOWO2_12_FULL_51_8]|nr:MAG: hypothetical protein A3G38_00740 [Omnitrophica WOR_2 bacterium RIFCSPLOWO2_12_FULL_51_8]